MSAVNRDALSSQTIVDLALGLGIGDLEKFLRACVANVAVAEMASRGRVGPPPIKYTVDEAAALLGVSSRWLADECRYERVEHVRMARRRYFTAAQLERVLADNVVVPFQRREADSQRARDAKDRAFKASGCGVAGPKRPVKTPDSSDEHGAESGRLA